MRCLSMRIEQKNLYQTSFLHFVFSDFAYVARDQASGKHRCHVFRCHGNILGRAIHNKLHEMCSKILAQRSKSNNNHQGSGSRQWSDILNTPPKQSALGNYTQILTSIRPSLLIFCKSYTLMIWEAHYIESMEINFCI